MAKIRQRISIPVQEISIGSKPTAGFDELVLDLKKVLGQLGCQGCRSGLDKIIITDPIRTRF